MTRMLLIEDDTELAEEVIGAMRARGYETAHCADGRMGLDKALAEEFDVIVTDRMLPGIDGLNLVKALRYAGRSIPVLVLSALDSVDERVAGLRSGSDDYLGKPFALEELAARVESLTRRKKQAALTSLKVDDLHIDLLARKATRDPGKLDNLEPLRPSAPGFMTPRGSSARLTATASSADSGRKASRYG